jgi:uncharacterized protein
VEHTIERIPVATMASGFELGLTIHTYRGGNGPTAGVSAAIHGDETITTEVVRRVAHHLDTSGEEVRGTIRLLPVANPLAYETRTRNTVLDATNLNRVFPGDPNGWVTEILADRIARHFIPGLEVYVDLHAGGDVPVVDYVYLNNSAGLSRAFRSKLLYHPSQPYQGTTATIAIAQGTPVVTVELGGGLFNEEHYAQRTVDGILNVLRSAGVLGGEANPAPEQILMHDLAVMRPHHGGILVPGVRVPDLGSEVPAGTVLGRIYSPYTFELLETIEAPFARSILVLLRDNLAPIHPGSYMYMIGNAETAEVLPAGAAD